MDSKRKEMQSGNEEEDEEDLGQVSAVQRQRLLSANQRLQKGSEKLENTIKMVEEMNQTGEDILLNLGQQREQIGRIQKNVSLSFFFSFFFVFFFFLFLHFHRHKVANNTIR